MSPPARTPVRRRVAGAVLVLTAAWWALHTGSTFLRVVSGDSMAPTVAARDLVLVLPIRSPPPAGAIVTVTDPRDPSRETVKRIAATSGQHADLAGEVAAVPRDHIVVLGDAPLRSTDSRHFGPVPARLVTGRVFARVWPRPRRLR